MGQVSAESALQGEGQLSFFFWTTWELYTLKNPIEYFTCMGSDMLILPWPTTECSNILKPSGTKKSADKHVGYTIDHYVQHTLHCFCSHFKFSEQK